jgi:hypothetical protein
MDEPAVTTPIHTFAGECDLTPRGAEGHPKDTRFHAAASALPPTCCLSTG